MFLRIIHSLNKTVKLNQIKFSRYISQTSPNPIASRPSSTARSLKFCNNKPVLLSPDVSSSMKLSVLKRAPKKKPIWKSTNILNPHDGQYFNVCAYATADWYDLDRLKTRFISSTKAYELLTIPELIDHVICIKIPTETKMNSQAFIFDDGTVVFWNVDQNNEKLILNEVNKK